MAERRAAATGHSCGLGCKEAQTIGAESGLDEQYVSRAAQRIRLYRHQLALKLDCAQLLLRKIVLKLPHG